jgi:ParB-like chromosome segregation protein Spo0J
MGEAELEALADDIKEHGQQQPIVLFEGQVLDGRNRLKACEKAGALPQFIEHQGDDASALALVISLNSQRRDLTPAQRALTAARTWLLNGDTTKPGPRQKKELSESPTIGVKELCRQFRTTDKTVLQARDLLQEAPDLAEQVQSGVLSLAAATELLEARRKEAKQRARDMARIEKYQAAVKNGDMTLQEALQKTIDEEREQKEKEEVDRDVRSRWLGKFFDLVDWVERWVANYNDDYLRWYGEVDSPGYFQPQKEVTAATIRQVIAQLERIATLTFPDGQGQKGPARARQRQAGRAGAEEGGRP